MTFTEHQKCLSKSGRTNVTRNIQVAFIIGFAMTTLDFINSAFFEFYIRSRTHRDKTILGYVSQRTEMLAIQYALLEWVFRILMVIVSAGQLAFILLSSTRHCVLETNELNLEGAWLFFLIIAQLFKIATLTLWHLRLNQRNVGYFNDLMSHESSVFKTKGRDSNFLTTSQIA